MEIGMRACVTGGTGFVGSFVVEALLAAGHDVRVLHRASSRLLALNGMAYESMIGDVTDLASLRVAFVGCDWVFHVAAVADYWQADHAWMFEVNVEGTRKVLQAARDAGVQRVVFTSSAAAVGLRTDGSPADETVAFNLSPERFPYGHSKVQAEAVVQEAVADFDQEIITVNPTIIIGPRDLNMISGTFIVQVAHNQWLTPVSSGGIPVTDVRDVAAAHLAAAEHGRPGERYLINTANYDIATWFALIAEEIGVAKPILHAPDWSLPPVAAFIRSLRHFNVKTPIDADQVLMGKQKMYYDASKAHSELYAPQITMRQSVADAYTWYVENGYIKQSLLTKALQRMGRLWS